MTTQAITQAFRRGVSWRREGIFRANDVLNKVKKEIEKCIVLCAT
jgi:hypothetical protein